jgi:hypothetical protein
VNATKGVRAKESLMLPPNAATMDDCYRIAELLLGDPLSSSIPLIIGFMHIVSTHELNETAVYTVSDPKTGSVRIDVEQVEGVTNGGGLR